HQLWLAVGCLTLYLGSGLLIWAFATFEAKSGDGSDFPKLATLGFFMAVLGTFACDVGFIAATRRLLRWAGEMTSSLKVIGAVAIFFFFAPLLHIAGPAFLFLSARPATGDNILAQVPGAISLGNIFDVLVALLFVLLALLLLIHRALWPLLTRTVFKMQDIG